MQPVKTVLLWTPQGNGRCPCGGEGQLFHAAGQPAAQKLRPICARCVEGVEATVVERRRRKGLNPDGTRLA